MNRQGPSFFIESSGSQDVALEAGFLWLVTEAQKAKSKGLVAVSTKQNLKNIANWSKFAPVFAELEKTGVAKIGKVSLGLFAKKEKRVAAWDGPILAIYGGQQVLDMVDTIAGRASVLYVPYVKGDYASWAATWGATELASQKRDGTVQEQPSSGVVIGALTGLTSSINLSSQLTHTSDRKEAIRTLETLFHKKVEIQPETIRRELVRIGWQPQAAAKVKKLADTIWAGRHPKDSTGGADEGLWNQWQSKAI